MIYIHMFVHIWQSYECNKIGGNFQLISLVLLFTHESSYCFQRVLAIAILSVCLSVPLSVCHTVGSIKNSAS